MNILIWALIYLLGGVAGYLTPAAIYYWCSRHD